MLLWSPTGKRIITGDKKGVVCVWAVDARGTLTPTRQYRKKGEITSATFCAMLLGCCRLIAARRFSDD